MAEGSPDYGATIGNLSTVIEGLSLVNESSSMEDTEFSDSEEAGEDENEESLVTLGFVQPVQEEWKVARQHFPSKVGGTPAWLDPIHLPEGDDTRCGICNKPLGFLMQVYAAIGAGDPAYREESFHRSLFLFVCDDMACLQQDQHHQRKNHSSETTKPCRSVKVFRSQLPRRNRFYSYEPASMEEGGGEVPPLCETVPLCTWCGTWKATDVCGGCKQTRYCCRTHQLAHWRAGHDSFCRAVQSKRAGDSNESVSDIQNANGASTVVRTMVQDMLTRVMEAGPRCPGISTGASDKLWPEMELIVEDEEDIESCVGSNQAHLLEDYESRREDGYEEFSAADMQDVEESSQEQKHWVAFQARLARAPDQVLRYCRAMGARPLWPSLEGQPREADIAPCAYCGGPRTFELQLLPQLLYFLGVQNEADNDSLDWATIAVYSCAASCNKTGGSGSSCEEGYAEEFAWVQLAVT